ncbi:MAG: ATP-binding protein [Planctomycetota bacterium]
MNALHGQGSRVPASLLAVGSLSLALAGSIAGMPSWAVVVFGIGGLMAGAFVVRAPAMAERRARAVLEEAVGRGRAASLAQAADAAVAEVARLTRELEEERSKRWHDRPDASILIESIGEPTMLVGGDGMVILANAHCTGILGLDQSPVGRHVEELITKAELLDEIVSARRGVGGRSTIRLPRPDGVRICETTAMPIASGGERSDVLVSMRDVTDLAGAMQLKTDFVANASHELRTPISAIRAAADTLQAAGSDESMRERLIGMILKHVTQLDELVRDLLDLSKLESAEAPVAVRAFSISELAADLASLFADACEQRGVELVFDLAPELESMETDRRMLMLIAKNLVENALKFAREGTAVRVVGVSIPGEADEPRGLELRVIDRGQGIPLAEQQRIFERFFQVDQSRTGGGQRGTGLGLAIVKHAAKLLDGTVEVDSVWGQGTTMIVRIPACVVQRDTVPGEGGDGSA